MAIRAKHRRAELVARLAALIGAAPEELVELLVEIGRGVRGGAS